MCSPRRRSCSPTKLLEACEAVTAPDLDVSATVAAHTASVRAAPPTAAARSTSSPPTPRTRPTPPAERVRSSNPPDAESGSASTGARRSPREVTTNIFHRGGAGAVRPGTSNQVSSPVIRRTCEVDITCSPIAKSSDSVCDCSHRARSSADANLYTTCHNSPTWPGRSRPAPRNPSKRRRGSRQLRRPLLELDLPCQARRAGQPGRSTAPFASSISPAPVNCGLHDQLSSVDQSRCSSESLMCSRNFDAVEPSNARWS